MKWPNPIKWLQRSSGALNPKNWLIDAYGGTETKAGVRVDGQEALQSPTVYACVSLIADTLASLPWNVKQDLEIQTNSPLQRLISTRPSENMQVVDFRRALLVNTLIYGNGYALPTRRGSRLHSLELLLPTDVSIQCLPNGEVRYIVHPNQGPDITLRPEQIIHVKAFTLDGIHGVSPITYIRETIGTDLAATDHLANFYGKGGTPKGYIKLLGTVRDPTKLQQIGSDFDANYGGPNAGKTAVLTEGAEYVTTSSSLADSQFIESQKWTTEEICRVFKVPPHKIGRLDNSQQNSSIEAQNSQFVTDCIRFWAELLEVEFTDKLINVSGQYLEIDFKSLLRGDTSTQVEMDVSYWNIGVLNANEIREKLGLEPIEGGDEYMKPLHMANQNDINNGQQDRPELH